MKKALRIFALIFSATLLLTLTSCEQPSSADSVDWGAAPPANLVGTWEAEITDFDMEDMEDMEDFDMSGFDLSGMSVTMGITVESSGKVTLYSKVNMTTFIEMILEMANEMKDPSAPVMTEAQLWDQMKEEMPSDPDVSFTFSKSKPWILTTNTTAKYEDISSDFQYEVSPDGKTVTLSGPDDEKVVLTKK